MSANGITETVMAAAVVLLIGYDVWTAIRHGVSSTISRRVLTLSRKWLLIPFAIGVLCGHFFWPQPMRTGLPPAQAKAVSK